MNAQEANGEQREKNGGKFAETDDFGRAVLKRKPPETAPTLGKRAKKIPTDKGWDFTLWWWGGTLRQTYVTQRLRTAANSCGKVRNPAPTANNPTSSAWPRSRAKHIGHGASSIPICGIEPAPANQSVASLNKAHVAVRPTMTSSDLARLMPT